MAKKDKNSQQNIHYSRTLTPDNLSKAANYVGEYFLKGLGTLGRFLNSGFTSPTYGTTGQVSYARNTQDAKRQREQSEASEQAMGKAMTWVSPLNYGAAVWNGHGLNAKKGEEEVASWSPAWQAVGRLGELYVGPKAVKGVKSAPKMVVNTVAKAGVKPAKAAVVAREIKQGIKQNTKNGRIEVTEDYFNSPDKWYRVTETPEKFGIQEQGKNITTRDNSETKGTVDSWRRGIIKNYTTEDGSHFKITSGNGSNEGYFIKTPDKHRFSLSKQGAAHGNTSQAAKGQIWGGTFAYSGKFPGGVLEGQAPTKIFRGMTEAGKDSRTNFILQDWDNVPQGARVGFHTGEMPMSNLGWFQRTNKGTYTYEPIIPEKRITYHPILQQEPSTSLKFFERKPSKISEAERAGVPKGDRNQPFKPKQLTEHVQGDDAVKMFKEYGGESIPEGSINGEQLRKYVAEARERYGLTNNKNITDEEIAQALYKHSKELGGNTSAINTQGEPQLLFRGDTRRYTQLKERMSPEELATKSGTMDNSLGNLFLGELPGTAGKRTRGLERYLVTGNEFLEKRLEGSGTGSRAVMPDGTFATEWGSTISKFPEGSYHLVTYNTKHGPNTYYKLPSSYSESGVNDINAFVVRTPQMRDASKEISVLNDDFMVKGGPKVEYHGPIRREVLDKDGFPLIVDENGNIVADGLAGSSDRQAMAQHYRYVLNDAKAKKQGLLKSKGETDGEPGNYLRDEHDDYSYFALPNFNIQGAKHLLPYDLRIKRNWKDKNIYRTLVPIAGSYTLYNLLNNQSNNQQLEYRKQGGKMNVLEFLKKGSGIHIKKKNRGKFTSYCGGKVTDECIRKAKASGNPTLVKRATFAANARKWKHKKGGKAFVEGVNVLDSNPKMSKAASRKVKKAEDGTKLNAFQKIGNFLNNDTGKAIGSTLMNGLSAGFQAKQMNDAINEYELASKSKLKKLMGISSKDYYNQALQTMNPNENLSSVVLQKRAYDIGQQEAQKMYNEAKDRLDQQMVGIKQYANEQTQNNFSNVFNGLGGIVSSFYNNKKPVDNGAPSTTVNVNGQIVNRENLGAYSQFMT